MHLYILQQQYSIYRITMHTYQDYIYRIQQIDEIAKRTIEQHERRIPEKYSNIEATLKLLNNLIMSFKKKSQNYQEELKHRAKIDDLVEQISFHKTRIVECEKMSHNLMKKIAQKRQKIDVEDEKVRKLRQDIITLKTDNVKKILKLEEYERMEEKKNEKENIQTRKITWKMKTEDNRQFYKEINKDKYKSIEIEYLMKDKKELTTAIYKRLDQKLKVNRFIDSLFDVMKGKLCHHEKKANLNGLNGSLMFKILENDKPCNPKPLLDSKLIIYDILKSKYKQHVKQQKSQKAIPNITEQDFMNYTSLQILGIIQLKGGLKKLRQKITKFEKRQQEDRMLKMKSTNAFSVENTTI